MPFQIIRDDITKVSADAIVNTANPKPVYGSGVDSAIYKAAGEDKLLSERRKIGDIALGNAVKTPAFNLDADYIIHTVGPAWQGGNSGEKEAVRACYENSLKLADNLGCKSIAFPLIATGTYGFPKDEALQIAISVFSSFLMKSDMDIMLVVFDKGSFVVSGKLVSDLKTYIDENYVDETLDEEYSFDEYSSRVPRNNRVVPSDRRRLGRMSNLLLSSKPILIDSEDSLISYEATPFQEVSLSKLDDLDDSLSDTWQELLFRYIDEKGLDPVEVYKKSNISRKLFSKINSNRNYQPKKTTVTAFAIGLRLSIDETKDFLARAGFAFSPSSKFDLIVRFYIEHGNYNILEINEVLFDYGLDTMGSPMD